MTHVAQQIAGKIQSGWNIGNTLEAIGGETAWGNPQVSAELIHQIKQSGFDAVRIPCSFDQYADSSTAEIPAWWLNRVKQVVQYCVDEELYVVLNIHWDGGWLENNVTTSAQAAVNEKQQAYWEQIATHLRDFDEHLLFAGANEPNVDNAEQMAVLMSYHQTFVDAVRSTGGRNAYRTLVVQGPRTDIEKSYDLMTSMPEDTVPNRMMVEVHYYSPYQFTLMTEDADWGNQFYYWGADYHSATDPDHNAYWGEEDWLDWAFGLMKSRFVDQGIPVVLGEYCASRRLSLGGDDLTLHLASRAHYHDYVTEQSSANGFIPFYWDNGYTSDLQSGIFNRWANAVYDQETVNAVTDVDTDQYWAAHGDAYADAPEAPTGLSAHPGDALVELSWSAVSGAAGYTLYRNSDGGASYSAIATSLVSTNYTDTELLNGTTYYYVVTAMNSGGTESTHSVVVSAMPEVLVAGAASAPSPADGADGIEQTITLSWTAGANADAHRIFFGYASNAVAAATTNSSEFMGLASGTTFDPGALAASGRFYWRIDSMAGDLATVGPVWTFATALESDRNVVSGTVKDDGNAFEVAFPGRFGQFYRIEFTDSLVPVEWQVITNNVPGVDAMISISDPTVTSQRYYRVILLNP